MEYLFCQILNILDVCRNLAPKEHANLILIVGTAQHIHNLLSPLATTCVGVNIVLTMPLLTVVICLSSSQLDTTECSTLNVRLHFQDPLDELSVGSTKSDTPTWHIVALRHRIELDAAVLGTWNLKNTQMLLTEDERIGVIVYYDDIMLLSKRHQSLVSLTTGSASRRHIRIVGPHQLHT